MLLAVALQIKQYKAVITETNQITQGQRTFVPSVSLPTSYFPAMPSRFHYEVLKIHPIIQPRGFTDVALIGAVLGSVYQQKAYFNDLFIVLDWGVNGAVHMLCFINVVLVIYDVGSSLPGHLELS